jgi:hypothetical protein
MVAATLQIKFDQVKLILAAVVQQRLIRPVAVEDPDGKAIWIFFMTSA